MGRTERPQWDPQYAAFMDMLLDNVRTRQAAEVGKRAVDYFRGQDFRKFVSSNSQTIKDRFPKVVEDLNLSLVEEGDRIIDRLIKKSFIYRAAYKPLSGTMEKTESGEVKIPKWPKRLEFSRHQIFDEFGFYVIMYEGSKTWRFFFLTLIIFAVLALFAFPAWPLYLKIAVWYISFTLLCILMFIIVVRLTTFLTLWFFGCDFWILPNLFDDDAGLYDSFVPTWSFVKRNDSWLMVCARIFCAFLCCVALYQLQQVHSVSDMSLFASQSYFDVLDWGREKLAALPDSKPKYPSLQDFAHDMGEHDSEEDVEKPSEECKALCARQSVEVCIKDCGCATNLWTSECISECAEEISNLVESAMTQVCSSEL